MSTLEKIQKAGELLADTLKDLSIRGTDTNNDLMLFLKDAEHATDLAYQHAEIYGLK